LPSTFQLSLQSQGKPLVARHMSVAFPCCSSTLEGGSSVRLGRVSAADQTQQRWRRGEVEERGGEVDEQRDGRAQERWRRGDFCVSLLLLLLLLLLFFSALATLNMNKAI